MIGVHKRYVLPLRIFLGTLCTTLIGRLVGISKVNMVYSYLTFNSHYMDVQSNVSSITYKKKLTLSIVSSILGALMGSTVCFCLYKMPLINKYVMNMRLVLFICAALIRSYLHVIGSDYIGFVNGMILAFYPASIACDSISIVFHVIGMQIRGLLIGIFSAFLSSVLVFDIDNREVFYNDITMLRNIGCTLASEKYHGASLYKYTVSCNDDLERLYASCLNYINYTHNISHHDCVAIKRFINATLDVYVHAKSISMHLKGQNNNTTLTALEELYASHITIYKNFITSFDENYHKFSQDRIFN